MKCAATLDRVIKHKDAGLRARTRGNSQDRRMPAFRTLGTQTVGLQQVMDHLREVPIVRKRAERPPSELAELLLDRQTNRSLHAIHFSLQFANGSFRLGCREEGAVLHEPPGCGDGEEFDQNDSGLLYTICIRCPGTNFGGRVTRH